MGRKKCFNIITCDDTPVCSHFEFNWYRNIQTDPRSLIRFTGENIVNVLTYDPVSHEVTTVKLRVGLIIVKNQKFGEPNGIIAQPLNHPWLKNGIVHHPREKPLSADNQPIFYFGRMAKFPDVVDPIQHGHTLTTDVAKWKHHFPLN